MQTLLKGQFFQSWSDPFYRLKWLYWLLSYGYHHVKSLTNKPFINIRWLISSSSQRVSFRSNSLTITGDLYQPEHTKNTPALLLLHGSSVFGRKLPLIHALAHEFSAIGYTVLIIDFRGYGESQDPLERTSAAFDFAQDVQSALDFLTSQVAIDRNQIYAFGHSLGAGVLLDAQKRDQRIKKAVLFGPPRRLSERFLNSEATDRKKLLIRWQADMQLDQPLSFSLWQQVLAPLNIENYSQDFSIAGHRPIFLIDADKESQEDLDFLREIYHRMVQPVKYWTVPASDHYLNTGFLLFWPCYDRPFVTAFVNRVDEWLKQNF
jgi:pimeloyl-ACP methyl ester carboxylesterase